MADGAEPRLTEVAPGVHAWLQPDGSWWINNAGAVQGTDGVILVDTCATAERTRRFLAALGAAIGGAPVRMAVNTHFHGDHAYGNALLPGSAVIVGHRATREELLADFILRSTPPIWSPSPDWGVTDIRPPTVVLDDALTLYAGERRIELRHPGHPAHTPGDVVAWLPDEQVLFTGDLIFHDVTPLVLMGSVEGALRSLDWLAAFGARTVVPGHGALITGDLAPVLAAHEAYYRLILDTARRGRAEGLTPLQAARACDLGPFAGWPDRERLVLNLHRAYADAEGGDLDLIAAFTDAIDYNGGPLRCAV
ncbi:MBL fold metallo-hydrolase [Actinoallomurus spadix]|uniref:MBL fold metallo-hydrolase n=1 Tax=Actinoallomurus spadix TaxID=79912 RepID=A0ABN0W044_9ACTN|nr:MBL fold metallo-hydrolase [Actinoallomurus spadix]MCO5988151.1 MBL fold metallo-hydrolase [Actinoallomurus spadix]